MLRILIGLGLIGFVGFVAAQENRSKAVDALKQASDQSLQKDGQAIAKKGLSDVENTLTSPKFQKAMKAWQEALDRVDGENPSRWDLNAIQTPDFIFSAKEKQYLNVLDGEANASPPRRGYQKPFVLISFSIPEPALVSVLQELKKIDSTAILQGLLDNDLDKTLKRLAQLAEQYPDIASVAIDPTLFERLAVTHVPVFVLPKKPIEPCTPTGCPAMDVVIAKGSVNLAYFLRDAKQSARLTDQFGLVSLIEHWESLL